MERNITLSPEALPYWNMIKDASPKVIDELGYYINTIHLYRKIKNRPKRDFDEFCGIWASDSEVSADELTKEGLNLAFMHMKEVNEGKRLTRDINELLNEL